MKKAISPLIATVLLIGFTIVLAGTLIGWSTGLFSGMIEEKSCETLAQTTCASNIKIELTNIDFSSNPKKLTIYNAGDYYIDHFIIIIKEQNNENTEKYEITENIPLPWQTREIVINDNTNSAEYIKIIHVIKYKTKDNKECIKTCEEKTILYNFLQWIPKVL